VSVRGPSSTMSLGMVFSRNFTFITRHSSDPVYKARTRHSRISYAKRTFLLFSPFCPSSSLVSFPRGGGVLTCTCTNLAAVPTIVTPRHSHTHLR
jgi:hypothetical protein